MPTFFEIFSQFKALVDSSGPAYQNCKSNFAAAENFPLIKKYRKFIYTFIKTHYKVTEEIANYADIFQNTKKNFMRQLPTFKIISQTPPLSRSILTIRQQHRHPRHEIEFIMYYLNILTRILHDLNDLILDQHTNIRIGVTAIRSFLKMTESPARDLKEDLFAISIYMREINKMQKTMDELAVKLSWFNNETRTIGVNYLLKI